MKRCECGHPSSFHRDVEKKGFSGAVDDFFGGSTSSKPVPSCNAKGCGCLRFVEDPEKD